MNAPRSAPTRPDADLIRTLEAADYHPLWDRYKRITPVAPRSRDLPMHWRWREFEPLAERAAKEVPIEDVERRALIMANPAFGGDTVTTSNLIGAFTILEPGDHAVPHRHTAAAIRFATRAAGAVTIVNGRRCEMRDGDLVLTPPWCWHGHINESDRRTYWFDAANMPLVCGLEANFFEPGRRDDAKFWDVDEGDERLYRAAGLAPASDPPRPAHSPKYRYPGEETRRVLAALAPGADGARTLRYVHPQTGGPVMPTLDCYAMRLAAGATTQPVRATWNAIVLVVAGEGRSTVGERTFEWARHDVFTVPHWTWAAHTASGGSADLFLVTDRAVYEALDLARVERQ
ncbi:MAG: cupin domain-containing protein [Burkholderiales bacterium]